MYVLLKVKFSFYAVYLVFVMIVYTRSANVLGLALSRWIKMLVKKSLSNLLSLCSLRLCGSINYFKITELQRAQRKKQRFFESP